jgi:hypothetical protein
MRDAPRAAARRRPLHRTRSPGPDGGGGDESATRTPDLRSGMVKKSLAKIFAKVRRRKSVPADATSRLAATVLRAPGEVTGRTIYGDRPLRFRRLTVPDPDLPSITDPSAFASAFKIRIAHIAQSPRDAEVLVERRYAGRGYQIPVVKRDPLLMTFLAYDEGQIVGTVSVRLDSPEKGLGSDDLYREENDRLREQGFRLCEFTQLAVDTAVASKPVLASLFHTAYLYAAVLRSYTYSVIEVNPRHAGFYARALRFEPIGPIRMNRRVNAPAILLGVPFDTIATGISQHAGHEEDSDGRGSLFRYGFPEEEQEGVLNRLRALVAEEQRTP